MTAEGSFATVVSREELDALLTNTPASDTSSSGSLRPIGLIEQGGGELAEVSKRFSVEQGRSLSTLHQTSIRFNFSHWEEINLRQFASAMVPTDRVATVDLGIGGEDVYFFINRPLIFGWMMMAFGARPESLTDSVPSRPYTRIEERQIQRAAENISSTFASILTGRPDMKTRVLSIEDPVMLYGRSKRPYRVISFDVEGFGNSGVLRICLPASLLDDSGADSSGRALSQGTNEVANQIYETPIEVHVEMGFAEIALCNLAQLAVGDELTLQPIEGDGLIVKVENTPKFRAEPGKIGNRLAVRITEVVEQ